MKFKQIIKNIFLTKEEKEYLKWYQKKYHKLSLKEKKCILEIYRKKITEEELKKELCDFFNVKNEEEWKELLNYYSLCDTFKS